MMYQRFIQAVKTGDLKTIDELGRHHPEILLNFLSAYKFYAFHAALENEHLHVFEKMITLLPWEKKYEMFGYHWLSAFNLALKTVGHLTFIEELFDYAQGGFREHVDILLGMALKTDNEKYKSKVKALYPSKRHEMRELNAISEFFRAQENGGLELLKSLQLWAPADLIHDIISANHFAAFREAAENGRLDFLNALIACVGTDDLRKEMNKDNYYAAFIDAACNGHLDVVTALMDWAPDLVQDMMIETGPTVFVGAFINNHHDITTLLQTLAPTNNLKDMIAEDNFYVFEFAASLGKMTVLTELKAHFPEKIKDMIRSNEFAAFRGAAEGGHLHIMETLITWAEPDLQQEMIKAADYAAFRAAAAYGYLHIMERLVTWVGPDLQQEMIKAADYAAFRSAAAYGYLHIMETLITWVGPDLQQEMICAKHLDLFRFAALHCKFEVVEKLLELAPNEIQNKLYEDNYYLLNVLIDSNRGELIDRLMYFPRIFAYVESHFREYGEMVQSFIERDFRKLRQDIDAFRSANPSGVFDITDLEQAKLYFYMMRHCIRRGSAESMQQLECLLSIPSVRALVHQAVTPNQLNELWRLARSLNHGVAATRLIQIPEVQELAEQYPFYRQEQDGIDLRAVAQDRESSMRALTQGQNKALERVRQQYQAEIDERGVDVIMNDLRQFLENRYHTHPATVHTEDGRVLELPFNDKEFKVLADTLSADTKERALKSYYQHPEHTAYRYLLKPNPWMSSYAVLVLRNGNDAWSYFEGYQPLISLLYLAAKDEAAPAVDNWTIEGRIENFILELALIGRAHNWDKSLENSNTGESEEYDDLEGDKPSCYSGTGTRLFQSVLGHPLLTILTKNIVLQEVQSVVRAHFISHINKENCGELLKAWNAILESGSDDVDILKKLNITKEEQEGYIASIKRKFDELYEGQFDVSLAFYLNALFNISRPFTHLAGKFGGQTDLLSILEDKTKEIEATKLEEVAGPQLQVLTQCADSLHSPILINAASAIINEAQGIMNMPGIPIPQKRRLVNSLLIAAGILLILASIAFAVATYYYGQSITAAGISLGSTFIWSSLVGGTGLALLGFFVNRTPAESQLQEQNEDEDDDRFVLVH